MSKIITIIGRKGTGKTTQAIKLLNQNRKTKKIVIDNLKQFKARYYYNIYDSLKNADKYNYYFATCTDEDFGDVCAVVWETGNICLFVDEVDFFNQNLESWKKLVHLGRHRNIDIITTSRRPANIHRDLTSQTDLFYIFNIIEPRDLEYFKDIHENLPEKVKNLEKYHFVIYDGIEIKIY